MFPVAMLYIEIILDQAWKKVKVSVQAPRRIAFAGGGGYNYGLFERGGHAAR